LAAVDREALRTAVSDTYPEIAEQVRIGALPDAATTDGVERGFLRRAKGPGARPKGEVVS
jgi:hypothetical protein